MLVSFDNTIAKVSFRSEVFFISKASSYNFVPEAQFKD